MTEQQKRAIRLDSHELAKVQGVNPKDELHFGMAMGILLEEESCEEIESFIRGIDTLLTHHAYLTRMIELQKSSIEKTIATMHSLISKGKGSNQIIGKQLSFLD